jgi:hypothetical protein
MRRPVELAELSALAMTNVAASPVFESLYFRKPVLNMETIASQLARVSCVMPECDFPHFEDRKYKTAVEILVGNARSYDPISVNALTGGRVLLQNPRDAWGSNLHGVLSGFGAVRTVAAQPRAICSVGISTATTEAEYLKEKAFWSLQGLASLPWENIHSVRYIAKEEGEIEERPTSPESYFLIRRRKDERKCAIRQQAYKRYVWFAVKKLEAAKAAGVRVGSRAAAVGQRSRRRQRKRRLSGQTGSTFVPPSAGSIIARGITRRGVAPCPYYNNATSKAASLVRTFLRSQKRTLSCYNTVFSRTDAVGITISYTVIPTILRNAISFPLKQIIGN